MLEGGRKDLPKEVTSELSNDQVDQELDGGEKVPRLGISTSES